MTLRDPAPPPGRIRRTKPAPFRRPSITIGGATQLRQWRTVAVRDLTAGDILPGVGRIDRIDETVVTGGDHAIAWTITVHGGAGNSARYHGTDEVWAFTARAAP